MLKIEFKDLLKYQVIICLILNQYVFSQEYLQKKNILSWSKMYSSNRNDNSINNLFIDVDSPVTKFINDLHYYSNNMFESEHIVLPNEDILKTIFIIDNLLQNKSREKIIEENLLIDSLLIYGTERHLLIDNYYRIIFSSFGKNNGDFDMSRINFHMDQLHLLNENEQAIFYFRCMEYCLSQVYGLTYIENNDKNILSTIDKYPMFDSIPYYKYLKINIIDFKSEIYIDQDSTSYKQCFLNKIYSVLLIHLIALLKEGKIEDANDLIQKSILSELNLLDFCSSPKREIITDIIRDLR